MCGLLHRTVLVAALALPASATPPARTALVWAREGGGLPNVWVANPDGSAQRRLFAKKGTGGVEGTFSPTDADLMFFTRFKEKPFSDDIYRGSLATEVARVIGGRSADSRPRCHPDGTKIAFPGAQAQTHREDASRGGIKVANIDGSGPAP